MFSKPIPLWKRFSSRQHSASSMAPVLSAPIITPVSHLSGTATNFGVDIVGNNRDSILHTGTILGCFFADCVLSAFIIRQSTLKDEPSRRYGVSLMVESVFLFRAMYFLSTWRHHRVIFFRHGLVGSKRNHHQLQQRGHSNHTYDPRSSPIAGSISVCCIWQAPRLAPRSALPDTFGQFFGEHR